MDTGRQDRQNRKRGLEVNEGSQVYKSQIDQVRAYWDAQPCNVRHSTAPFGTRRWSYEVTQRKYFIEPHIPTFADFERWRGKAILEIGCGIGTDTQNFAAHGAYVTAVDLSKKSLGLAASRPGTARVEFIQADVEHLDEELLQEPFDLIYSFGVLHHTPNPDKALAQMRKFAAPGTVLKVMVYHRWSWKALRIALGFDRPEAQAGCPIARTYSRRAAKKFIENAGFRVTEMCVDHIFPYSIPEYKRHEYRKVWYFRWMPRALFRLLERTIGWHLLITAEA